MSPLPTLHSLLQVPWFCPALLGVGSQQAPRESSVWQSTEGTGGAGPGCMAGWTSKSDGPLDRRAWARCAASQLSQVSVGKLGAREGTQSGGNQPLEHPGLVRSGVQTVPPSALSGACVTQAWGKEHSSQETLPLSSHSPWLGVPRASAERASFSGFSVQLMIVPLPGWKDTRPLSPRSTLFKINF